MPVQTPASDASEDSDADEKMDAEDTENVPVANGKKRKADEEAAEAPAKTAPKAAPGACTLFFGYFFCSSVLLSLAACPAQRLQLCSLIS